MDVIDKKPLRVKPQGTVSTDEVRHFGTMLSTLAPESLDEIRQIIREELRLQLGIGRTDGAQSALSQADRQLLRRDAYVLAMMEEAVVRAAERERERQPRNLSDADIDRIADGLAEKLAPANPVVTGSFTDLYEQVAPPPFAIGDTVWLKTCGPAMRVLRYVNKDTVRCKWLTSQQHLQRHHEANFEVSLLTATNPIPPEFRKLSPHETAKKIPVTITDLAGNAVAGLTVELVSGVQGTSSAGTWEARQKAYTDLLHTTVEFEDVTGTPGLRRKELAGDDLGPTESFAPGDVVYLKWGSKRMIVEKIAESTKRDGSMELEVCCRCLGAVADGSVSTFGVVSDLCSCGQPKGVDYPACDTCLQISLDENMLRCTAEGECEEIDAKRNAARERLAVAYRQVKRQAPERAPEDMQEKTPAECEVCQRGGRELVQVTIVYPRADDSPNDWRPYLCSDCLERTKESVREGKFTLKEGKIADGTVSVFHICKVIREREPADQVAPHEPDGTRWEDWK